MNTITGLLLKVRTLLTTHPVIAAAAVGALVTATVLRVTNWDLKILEADGRMLEKQGMWYQSVADKQRTKRLNKSLARSEKAREKAEKSEAKRIERAHRIAEKAKAKTATLAEQVSATSKAA